jgi:hypothetical protein
VPFLCTFSVTTQDLGDIIASSHSPERSIGVSWRFKIPWGYCLATSGYCNITTLGVIPDVPVDHFSSFPCMLHTPFVVFIFAARRKVECGDECPPIYYCDYIPQDLYAIVSPYDVSVSLLRTSDTGLVAQTYGHMRSILSKKLRPSVPRHAHKQGCFARWLCPCYSTVKPSGIERLILNFCNLFMFVANMLHASPLSGTSFHVFLTLLDTGCVLDMCAAHPEMAVRPKDRQIYRRESILQLQKQTHVTCNIRNEQRAHVNARQIRWQVSKAWQSEIE